MKPLRTLTARYLILSLVILAFIGGLAGSTFLLTAHLEGEARKINLAGRQRMHVLHLALYMHALPSLGAAPDAEERRRLTAGARRAAAAFEEVLYGLRSGSASLDLRPVHGNDRRSLEMLASLTAHWETAQKPLLMELLSSGWGEKHPQACDACHAAFQDHLQDIDNLVVSLEKHSVQELALFKWVRLFALVVLVFIALGMGLYVRKKMIRPIKELEQAAGRIREGEFRVRLPVAGDDEIGTLTRTFASMAETMGSLFRRLAMLAQALDSSPDLVLVTDPTGVIVHANPRADNVLGCPAQEIVGRQLAALLAAGPPDVATHLVAQTLAGGGEGELPAVRKDGSRFPALCTTAPVRDERTGEVVALIVIVRDISRQKEAEAALRASEARFRALVEKSSDLIWEVNEELQYTYISPRVELILGYRPEEILGRTPFDLMQPEEAARIRAAFAPIAAARLPFSGLTNSNLHKNGGLVVLETGGEPIFDDAGRWRGYRGIDRDISERMRGEQRKEQEDARLRASLQLDRMPGNDEQAILDFVLAEEVGLTGSAYGFLGWVDGEESRLEVSAWSREVLPACSVPEKSVTFPVAGGGVWAEPLHSRAPVMINDYGRDGERQNTPPGHVEIRRFLGVPVFHGDRIVMLAGVANKQEEYNRGDVLTLSTLLADAWRVIQRNRALAEVRQSNEELEQLVTIRTSELEQARRLAEAANRAKSEFLANMSHELRTPLNAVMGFADVIRNGMAGPTTAAQVEYLGDIMESGEHLLSLINDILDLAKVEAGQQDLELAEFPVAELVAHSLSLFREKAIKHAIALASEVDEETGSVTADQRKLKQVLVNLLANALKFTPEGGSVLVSAAREGGNVRFSVADTGTGIAAEDFPRLFQPFQQLESSLSRKYPGTGLGLSLCRKLVEMHGGRIWAESSPGAGSRFSFVVPALPACLLPEAAAEGAGGESAAAGIIRQAGRQHLERLISFQQRHGLKFALQRFRFPGPAGREAAAAAALLFKEKTRAHDMIIMGDENQTLPLVLVGTEQDTMAGIAGRFEKALRDQGYDFASAQAFSPRDGTSCEELELALNRQQKQEKSAPAGESME